jgi:fatty-acyl-CoA synthase
MPLSHAVGDTSVPLLDITIGQSLRAAAERFSDRDAVISRHQSFRCTYTEFQKLTGRVARSLLALGVGKGERVGIWAPNCFEWPIIQYATARIGAILVNINPSYRTVELEYALNQSGISVLILARGYRQTEYGPIWEGVRPRCQGVRHAIRLDGDWDNLLAAGEAVAEAEITTREAMLCCDDPINIQYTSGTTGHPKGATLTHRNILNNAYFAGRALRYSAADRVCLPVPFYHCFGMVLGSLACVAHGACMVLPSEGFDPRAVLDAVEAEGCTSLYGVPTMFVAVLEQQRFEDYDLASLRTGIMAGAPCPAELMRQVVTRLHMPEVAIGYGMTELSPIATFTPPGDPPERRVASVGRVLDHVEAKVIDAATGETVPPNVPGEFCARGHGVMHGYWDDPAATAAAVDADGWMHSGDLATMDDDGYFHIVGRIKDMIIRGGENIYPREVEDYLLTHAGVSEVQVIGVPDSKYGEEVMAWLKPQPGAVLSVNELTRFCRGQIAVYKIPRYWKMVTEFPLTVTGKVQKFRLQEQAVTELGLSGVGPHSAHCQTNDQPAGERQAKSEYH